MSRTGSGDISANLGMVSLPGLAAPARDSKSRDLGGTQPGLAGNRDCPSSPCALRHRPFRSTVHSQSQEHLTLARDHVAAESQSTDLQTYNVKRRRKAPSGFCSGYK